jgi:Protein of unknown function (DUF1176)
MKGFDRMRLSPLLAGLLLAMGAMAGTSQTLAPPLQQAAPPPQPAPPKLGAPEIELKLFEKGEREIDRAKGCTVAIWQGNRDPEKDRYAVLFIEQLRGRDHARDPARIRIGTNVVPLVRIATGGKSPGYDLHEYQLYRMQGGDGYVVLDLKLGPLEGEAVAIESGKMMVSMLGKEAFRASVKGGAGCIGAPLPTTPAVAAKAPPAPAIPPVAPPPGANVPALFQRYTVPAKAFSPAFRKEVQKKFKCNSEVMKSEVIGYSMSEESALWEIPCDRFAYQGSSVFALVYTPAPEKQHTFLKTPAAPGLKRPTDAGVLMSPTWDIKTRTVTALTLGRGSGDCGTLEKFRVTPEGEFALVEVREKPQCDGNAMPPEQFPLVYPKR